MRFMDERKRGVPDDPSGIERPHDVLAAEEFGIGARDAPWPADPSGIQEPHDVLAAEEFAMPAGDYAREPHRGSDPRSWVPMGLVAAAALLLLLRRWQR